MKIIKNLRNRIFPYLILTSLGSILLTGCEQTKTELSDILHEDAIVSDVVYSPSNHGSGVGPTFNIGAEDTPGVGLAVTSVSIPEKYAVVFKCKHGKFIVEGTDNEHKKLWERLEQGQEVDVTYREFYRCTYDDIDKDGKKELINKELIDYDFLDAQPKKK